ncbi:MAG: efflux RND transporter periplasmic adaptor subunit [Acidobacteria bacterium]|nr:efflux RND transporter periplasmic adaptor subunit [Acidobacteriota bacterium]
MTPFSSFRKTRGLGPWLMAAAILSLAACGGGEHAAETAERATPAPVNVRTEKLAPTELAQQTALIGNVSARTKVMVAAKLMSYVKAVHAREGSRVRAGQTLVELDAQEIQTGLAAAEAMRAEAEAAIASAAQGIASAQAQRDLAASTNKRFEELLSKKSVAQQEFDEIAARLRSAEAGLALARSQQSQAEAKRAQADAAIAQAKVQLGYAKVVSPINGVVVSRMVDPGALAAPGMPLLEIEQTNGYQLEIAVPESDAGSLRIGQELAIRLDSLGADGPTSGRINEIVPSVDPGSRTFIAKIALPNILMLRSGLYGKAFLPGQARETLTVPALAVVDRGQLQAVFVVEDGHVRRRLVTLGEQHDNRIEVLSGLSAGDEVVLNPAAAVDGAPVGGR